MNNQQLLASLTPIAQRGLSHGFIADEGLFAQTVRSVSTKYDTHLQREGLSLRYTAIAALGLAACTQAEQRETLDGLLSTDLLPRLVDESAASADLGSVALAAWAVAELTGKPEPRLMNRMRHAIASGAPLPTVDTAWVLTAAVAALRCPEQPAATAALANELAKAASALLLRAQGALGIFPHAIPASSQGRWRAHVGCFADQVYPIQALARWAEFSGDTAALRAAEQTAAQICALQGASGEWWWHYDSRTGEVVEGYPVYSVHQHAMAPMALFDLAAAGGTDHTDSVHRGLDWISTHSGSHEEVVSERFSLVWRKVGRREPRKASRAIAALTTSLRPGWKITALETIFPVGVVDKECRPYELGWLLYAWLRSRPTLEQAQSTRSATEATLASPERNDR